jgi:phage recombination protein Bet
MANANAVVPFEALAKDLATTYQVEPAELIATVKAICFDKGAATDPQLFTYLSIAKQLELNPFNREIYAFVGKAGKMQIIVGFDGWVKMGTRNPQFNGFEFFDHIEDNKLVAVTCRMWRKDWQHPAEATEYMDECTGDTDPWKKWPRRMLRNKAYIQCARMTFGFAGVVDPDEAERIAAPEKWPDAIEVKAEPEPKLRAVKKSAPATSVTPPSSEAETPAPTATQETPPPETPATVASGRKLPDREWLAALMEELPAARLNLLLTQAGVASVDEMDDAQVAATIAKIESRKGK